MSKYFYQNNSMVIEWAILTLDNEDIVDTEYFADLNKKDLPKGKYGVDWAIEIYVRYGDPKQNRKEEIKEYKDSQDHVQVEYFMGLYFADLSLFSKAVQKKIEKVLIKLGGA
jgi:hypothetical protein